MTVAKSAVWLPDITLRDLGMLDLKAALEAFDAFPWVAELKFAEQLDAAGTDSMNPDITFQIGKCHLTATIQDDGNRFDVEVCVPRIRKVLGIFGGAKFYTLASIGRQQAREAIRIFFSEPAERQHESYAQMAAGAT